MFLAQKCVKPCVNGVLKFPFSSSISLVKSQHQLSKNVKISLHGHVCHPFLPVFSRFLHVFPVSSCFSLFLPVSLKYNFMISTPIALALFVKSSHSSYILKYEGRLKVVHLGVNINQILFRRVDDSRLAWHLHFKKLLKSRMSLTYCRALDGKYNLIQIWKGNETN